MSRDHRKLRVFNLADDLVTRVYEASKEFPVAERFGLQQQLRRAAVSVACNIVEGAARSGEEEYLGFLNIVAGSASEARTLCELSGRFGYFTAKASAEFEDRYCELCASIQALIASIRSPPRS